MSATFCIAAPPFPLKNNKSQGQGKAGYVKPRFGMARETWMSASFLTFRNRYLVLEWRGFHVNISYTEAWGWFHQAFNFCQRIKGLRSYCQYAKGETVSECASQQEQCYFVGKKAKVQSGRRTGPRWHSWFGTDPECHPGSLSPCSCCFSRIGCLSWSLHSLFAVITLLLLSS